MVQKSKQNLKVFVVEDSKSFSNWIREELEKVEGVSVEEIGGEVKIAKEKILEEKPDVITLDIRLSNGSGIEILKDIVAAKLEIKVIVFTNYPWMVFQKQCLNLGADYFYDKMHDSDKLTETIEEIQSDGNSKGKLQTGFCLML